MGKVDGAEVVHGGPVRSIPTYKGHRNYPGVLWLATTGGHVVYESLLERNRLLLADFDPTTTWIAAQPLWLSGREGLVVTTKIARSGQAISAALQELSPREAATFDREYRGAFVQAADTFDLCEAETVVTRR